MLYRSPKGEGKWDVQTFGERASLAWGIASTKVLRQVLALCTFKRGRGASGAGVGEGVRAQRPVRANQVVCLGFYSLEGRARKRSRVLWHTFKRNLWVFCGERLEGLKGEPLQLPGGRSCWS